MTIEKQVSTRRASHFVPNVPAISVSVSAFQEIVYSIDDAWQTTNVQMAAYEYEERVVLTAFGQFLVHNVMQKIYENLNENLPGVKADLVLNSRRSAYHVAVHIPGMLITISAVNHPQLDPRAAIFRETYASLQMAFGVNSNDALEILDPPDISNFSCQYFQVRHGPKADDRQQLGFVVVVPIDGFGEPLTPPQAIDSFLNDLTTSAAAVDQPTAAIVPPEDIKPNLPIKLHP